MDQHFFGDARLWMAKATDCELLNKMIHTENDKSHDQTK